jgi:hypothetical protein
MKFVISILLIALLSFLSGLYLPWWGIALASFLVSALIQQRPWLSFLGGFTAVFLLWAVLSWSMDAPNNSILSRKIAEILPLGGSSLALILITALVGALVGGLAALTGSFLQKKKEVNPDME